MISFLFGLLKLLVAFVPFFLLLFVNNKVNLKREYRSRQEPMVIVTLVYCILFMVFMEKLIDLIKTLLELLALLLLKLAASNISILAILGKIGIWLTKILNSGRLEFALLVALNLAAIIAYLIIKLAVVRIFKATFTPEKDSYRYLTAPFYEQSTVDPEIYVIKNQHINARTYMKAFYIGAIIISGLAMLVSAGMYKADMINAMFYPVVGILLIGEIYYFFDGLTDEELKNQISGEQDRYRRIYNYSLVRGKLRELFGDKLAAENSSFGEIGYDRAGKEEVLSTIDKEEKHIIQNYVQCMRNYEAHGNVLDTDYLASGVDLIRGKNVLYNNPFYYDLIPYAFFAMDRVILRKKKILVVLGRHGIEKDIIQWCEDGFYSISHIPGLWRIGKLGGEEQNLDVGIITRSDVHNLKMHENNTEFLRDVEFVVLIEPSKLVTTAQVGLNSLIKACRNNKQKNITFCSLDKNCDGLVDSLSHILMTNIVEVAATNRQEGVCSYMCWAPDDDYLQHRMLPNIARYLGVGTELSFAGLKNQISHTSWYGGSAFPVLDMHWIAKQYYYDLLKYAGQQTNQENVDTFFEVSHNLWNDKKKNSSYITVEDESYNVFEVKREFATRAKEESFINVITSNYLLRDYMTSNDGCFNTDPKAIPYVAADYARTRRNVALRLALRMSVGPVSVEELGKELQLIYSGERDPIIDLWHEICTTCGSSLQTTDDGSELFVYAVNGKSNIFDIKVFEKKRTFNFEKGIVEETYVLSDEKFKKLLLDDIQSAEYVAEDEEKTGEYLGTELKGHIYQKYLPGQLFTFNGKYYEMVSVTNKNKVIIRRAADHITGRPLYRQVRNYYLDNVKASPDMGSRKNIGGMTVSHLYANISVSTPAYWKMSDYSDFVTGKKVELNGVPDRHYNNKEFIKIDFSGMGELFNDKICNTIALLMNEVLRSMLAENQDYVAVVSSNEQGIPFTYNVYGQQVDSQENAIYIFEDSQLDLGLLIAVERNLDRIISIIFDYLEWHEEELKKSLKKAEKDAKKEEKKDAAQPEPNQETEIKGDILMDSFNPGMAAAEPVSEPEIAEPVAESEPSEPEPVDTMAESEPGEPEPVDNLTEPEPSEPKPIEPVAESELNEQKQEEISDQVEVQIVEKQQIVDDNQEQRNSTEEGIL